MRAVSERERRFLESVVGRENPADCVRGVGDVNLPRIAHALIDVLLDARLRVEPDARAIIIARAAVIVVVEMHGAPAHRGHPLLATLRPPVVMEGDMQLPFAVRLLVIGTEQAGERVVLIGLIIEFAPRHRDVVGRAADVQVAVHRIHECAMVNPDVA